MSHNLWLVALPNRDDKYRGLQSVLKDVGVSTTQFDIPPLPIGTLDSLMALTDDLIKVNTQVEGILKKIERQYWDVADEKAESLKVKDLTVDQYCLKFSWDASKYRFNGVSMNDIVSQIVSTVGGVDEELKKLGSVLAEKQQALSSLERRKTVNFSTSEFEDFLPQSLVATMDIVDTDSLVTMMCVMPSAIEADFLMNYDKIGEGIAAFNNPNWEGNMQKLGSNDGNFGPRIQRDTKKGSPIACPRKVCGNDDQCMYSVVALRGQYQAGMSTVTEKSDQGTFAPGIFVDYLEPLVHAAREKRIVMRPWKYDNSKVGGVQAGIVNAQSQVTSTVNRILQWCRSHFGEIFSAWMHLKAIRAFAESVLRYGVPSNGTPRYIYSFVHANERNEKAAMDTLVNYTSKTYEECSVQALEEGEETEEYLSFVFQKFLVIGNKKSDGK